MRPFLVLLVLLAVAAASPAGTTVTVEAGGEIEHVTWRDLDGDGRPDLLLLVRTEAGAEEIVLHRAREDGRILPEADQRIAPFATEALRDTVLLATADLTPDPGVELVLVGPGTVQVLPLREGRFAEPRKVADSTIPFARPDDAGVRVWPHVFRPAVGEREALALPSGAGYAILRIGDDGTPRTDPIDVAATRSLTVGSHDLFALVTETPTPVFVDDDGDGRTDVLFAREGRLAGHLPSRSGTFPREPTFDVRLAFLEEGAGAARRDEFVRYLVLLEDVDGDHRADLLVTRTRGKIELFTNFESQHFFYRGPSFYSKERNDLVSPPAGLIAVSGVSINPRLFDFDGDGKKDLVITAMQADAVGQHLLKRVLAEYRVYRFDAGRGTFERSPYLGTTRRYPVDRLQYGRTDPTVFLEGDFDGDGNRDLLDIASGGEDRIEIKQGERSSRYSFGKTLLRLAGRVESDVRILDADGDGADDLLLHDEGKVFVIYTGR